MVHAHLIGCQRNRDHIKYALSLEEVQGPILRLFQFLVGAPGKSLGIEDFVSAFDKLREPPIVSSSLRQLLTPLLETLPRQINVKFVHTFHTQDCSAIFCEVSRQEQ